MNGLSRGRQANVPGTDAADHGWNRDWLWGAVLVLAILLVYQPAWRAGFIWDDDRYITGASRLSGWQGLQKIWTTSAADISPLTTTTFWLLRAIFGTTPLPYHLVSVFTHSACALVLWRVLRSLQVPGAWLGAALWALHPVEVESVAWAAELKNPESGLFFLLAVLFFVKSIRRSDAGEVSEFRWMEGLALLFAAMAMASKSSTVILPVVLCLCAWWIEGRWHWRNLVLTAPFFLMSAVASLSSIWFERGQIAGLGDPLWLRTWPERLVTAGDAVWFYLGKLIWPHPLATIYPCWHVAAGNGISYLPLIAVIALLILLWAMRKTPLRPGFFVFAYFVVALAPVLGFLENTIFQYSLVFDHFQYLASMAPLALAGALISCTADFIPSPMSWLRASLFAGVLLIPGVVSWQRVSVYENARTLWTDALAKNQEAWIGHNNLGIVLLGEGRMDEAIAHFRTALSMNPHNEDGNLDLGDALLRQGKDDEALVSFQKALEINARSGRAYCNIGVLLLKQGKIDDALVKLDQAVEIFPASIQAQYALADTLRQKGDFDQALLHYRRVVALDPTSEGGHYGLGLIFMQKGPTDDGIAEFRKVIELNPKNADAYKGLADGLMGKGELDEAISNYEKCVKLDPHNADALTNYGNVLSQQGRLDDAVARYQKSLEIAPNDPITHNNLGAAYFQLKQWNNAISEFQKMAALDPGNYAAHYCLGMAFSKKGETEKAIAEYRKAVAISPKEGPASAKLNEALAQKKAAGNGAK